MGRLLLFQGRTQGPRNLFEQKISKHKGPSKYEACQRPAAPFIGPMGRCQRRHPIEVESFTNCVGVPMSEDMSVDTCRASQIVACQGHDRVARGRESQEIEAC